MSEFVKKYSNEDKLSCIYPLINKEYLESLKTILKKYKKTYEVDGHDKKITFFFEPIKIGNCRLENFDFWKKYTKIQNFLFNFIFPIFFPLSFNRHIQLRQNIINVFTPRQMCFNDNQIHYGIVKWFAYATYETEDINHMMFNNLTYDELNKKLDAFKEKIISLLKDKEYLPDANALYGDLKFNVFDLLNYEKKILICVPVFSNLVPSTTPWIMPMGIIKSLHSLYFKKIISVLNQEEERSYSSIEEQKNKDIEMQNIPNEYKNSLTKVYGTGLGTLSLKLHAFYNQVVYEKIYNKYLWFTAPLKSMKDKFLALEKPLENYEYINSSELFEKSSYELTTVRNMLTGEEYDEYINYFYNVSYYDAPQRMVDCYNSIIIKKEDFSDFFDYYKDPESFEKVKYGGGANRKKSNWTILRTKRFAQKHSQNEGVCERSRRNYSGDQSEIIILDVYFNPCIANWKNYPLFILNNLFWVKRDLFDTQTKYDKKYVSNGNIEEENIDIKIKNSKSGIEMSDNDIITLLEDTKYFRNQVRPNINTTSLDMANRVSKYNSENDLGNSSKIDKYYKGGKKRRRKRRKSKKRKSKKRKSKKRKSKKRKSKNRRKKRTRRR